MTDDKWLLEPANAKPMTVQQRAWELISFFKRYGAHFENDIESAKCVIEVIQQACDQARAEGYTQGCADTIHNSPMYEAGFSDCREMAAKVCDDNTKPSKEICNSDYHDIRWCSDCDRMTSMADVLGQEIRALTPGEGAMDCGCACHSIPERYAHLDGQCLGCLNPEEGAP